MVNKKNKYRPVTTNSKKEKKKSSLSCYKFVALGKPCDFVTFKKEVDRIFTLLLSSSISPRVGDYYTQLCRDTFSRAIKLLKDKNSDTVRECPVTLSTDGEVNEIVLSDLGPSYTFDKSKLTITHHFKDGKDIVNEDAAKFQRLIQYTTGIATKKRETKDLGTQILVSDWIPIRENINMLEHAPEHYHDWNGDKIVERAKITDLRIKITNKKDEDSTSFTLKVNSDQNNQFVYGLGKNRDERTVAFMIETTAKDLLLSLDKSLYHDDETVNFWNKYFTDEVKVTIFCTGKMDIHTGEMSVFASVVYKAAPDEFHENVNIEITDFKTDASVYVDKAQDLPKETLDNILKEAEVDPLGVMESKN